VSGRALFRERDITRGGARLAQHSSHDRAMALLQAWRHASRVVERASRECVYRVVVVGAGVEGSSAALHITKCGASPVLLLEQVWGYVASPGGHIGRNRLLV